MRRLVPFLSIALVLVPSAAVAMGPAAATVVAPDGSRAVLDAEGYALGSDFVNLLDTTHAISAVLIADTRAIPAPAVEDLGPRYRVLWFLGMSPDGIPIDPVVQEIYPYAVGGPVSYVPRGQNVWDVEATVGGWYTASSRLPDVIESLDFVLEPPRAGGALTDLVAPSWPALVVIAGLLLGLLALEALRTRPATS